MLARLARNRTGDGLELIEFALSVLRGEAIGRTGKGESEVETPSIRDRIEAMKWLADRGWGKAVETVEIHDETEAQPTAADVEALEAAAGGPEGTIQ
jgi:hypothetical protein